jgi:hypothetical protein
MATSLERRSLGPTRFSARQAQRDGFPLRSQAEVPEERPGLAGRRFRGSRFAVRFDTAGPTGDTGASLARADSLTVKAEDS